MNYNRFHINIIVRIACIVLSAILFAFLNSSDAWFYTSWFVILIICLQALWLIYFVNRTNRELASFLIALKEQDVSQLMSKKWLEKNFKGLNTAFQKVNREMAELRSEKKKKEQDLQLVLNQVQTGIIAFNEQNEIKYVNPAFWMHLDIKASIEKQEFIQEFILENKNYGPGEQWLYNQKNGRQFLLGKAVYKQQAEKIELYSLHNVNREMTHKEMESWSGLIRILMHEIMNTLTPISTLLDTVCDCIAENNAPKKHSQLEQDDINDAFRSNQIIEHRIKALADFVRRFKQFTQLPSPNIQSFLLFEFLENISSFFGTKQNCIYIENIGTDFELKADASLCEQVFINLIKNAFEACGEDPKIIIKANKQSEKTIISIKDNGSGIPNDLKQKITTPFFTTKENGSGIGLSLSRQIMFLHGGELQIESEDLGTEVILSFLN